MNLERVDLNLFRVFNAVMTHRSVAAASRDLGVTASAVSHALKRLRQLLGDELFILGSDGMVPTQAAIDFAPNIRDGLASIARALDARRFDPATLVRTFSIAASDLTATLILPRVMARLLERAPNASLQISPLGRLDVVQQLDDGRLDLVLGWFDTVPDRMRRRTLMLEQEALVVRAGHPLTRQRVTRQTLFAFPHAVVEFTGTEAAAAGGFLDDRGVMRRIWIERLLVETGGTGRRLVGGVPLTLPNYAAIAPMLLATDMIATLPERLAKRAVERDGLAMLPLPYPPLSVAVEMVWPLRAEANPSLRWLIEQVSAASDEFLQTEAAGP